ncbi:MAG TPA: sugar transferase [Anaerolineales bacterium]|jgi:lipopolysaccharide/colanic/teichoic acid biosynthesis glycosyltransferase|nr:sugar transferase [Anaerolineales bacterium]
MMSLTPRRLPVIKRLFDLVLVLPGLVLISPILALVAATIWIGIGSPVIFRQTRAGRGGNPFVYYKFRTMTNERDAQGELLPDEQRLTAIGRFLRSLSLDELPSLLNVIRGEMSLVGPRPLYVKYLERYSPEQSRRLEVTPGITGLAQISGRNALAWEERFRLDVWYVDHWSLWLDLKILLVTFWKVIRREAISQPGHATSEEFRG